MKQYVPKEASLNEALLILFSQNDSKLRTLLAEPDQPYSAWLARAHSLFGSCAAMLGLLPGLSSLMLPSLEKAIPGGALHFLAFKRFIEDQTNEAIVNGVKQIVIFGPGYDSLGIQIVRKHPEINVFEVDEPATQAVKMLGLERKMIVPANLHFLPVDFRKGTLERHLLQEQNYDSKLQTLFIAVRVLPFLPEMEVDEIFNFIWERAAIKSRVIFSIFDIMIAQDPTSLLYQEAKKQKEAGRPIQSGADFDVIEKYLFQRGLKGLGYADDNFIAENYLRPADFEAPPYLGEMIVVAEKADWTKWMLSGTHEKAAFRILGTTPA